MKRSVRWVSIGLVHRSVYVALQHDTVEKDGTVKKPHEKTPGLATPPHHHNHRLDDSGVSAHPSDEGPSLHTVDSEDSNQDEPTTMVNKHNPAHHSVGFTTRMENRVIDLRVSVAGRDVFHSC